MKLSYKIITLFFLSAICFISCQSSGQETHKTQEKQFETKNPYYSRTDTAKLNVPKSTWKKILPPKVYHIAFERGTEKPFKNQYWNYKGKGVYYCAVCGNKLFSATAKFASTCGWPSFFEPSRKNAVVYQEDHRLDMNRIEVRCARCGAHLGHVFHDGPPPTGLRYCMNSLVLDFVPKNAVATIK